MPSKAVLALDFDQTLTFVRPTGPGGARQMTLRGGEEARQALDEMATAGVRMCIVTAQSPSAATVQNAAKECRELGIDKLFDVQPPDIAPLHAALVAGRLGGAPPGVPSSAAIDISEAAATPGAPLDLSDGGAAAAAAASAGGALHDATLRLVLLLLLKTDRQAADLARIGATATKPKDDGAMAYRMWNVASGGWSGEQRLPPDDAAPALCPVRAWEAYAAATAPIRQAAGSAAPERLLLSPSAAARGEAVALTADEVTALASSSLAAAGLSARDVRWVVSSPAKEIALDGGIKIAMMGNLVAARYNKPEGLQAWLKREGLAPQNIAFVDDNSDNAFSMFMSFAALEKAYAASHGAPTRAAATDDDEGRPPTCCAVWYPPETSATQENYDAQTREMLVALSRGPL